MPGKQPRGSLAKIRAEVNLLHKITEIISSHFEPRELLPKIAKLILEVTGGDSCLIYTFDETRESLVLQGAHNPHPGAMGRVRMKLGEGITGWVAEHRKPVAIAQKAFEDPRFKFFSSLKEDRYEAFLSTPISWKGELVGVINVQHRKARQHPQEELNLISTVSRQVAGAIAHAHLFNETKRKARQLDALLRVSKSIAEDQYLQEILNLIVSVTAEGLHLNVCSLMLLDPGKNELKIEATQSLSDAYRKKPPIPVQNSVSGRAVKESRPIQVKDVTKDPLYSFPDIAKSEGLCSLLSVPMMIKDKPIGVINCYTQSPHTFSEEEIKHLQSIANQAAVAIEKTRLLEQTLAAKEELETRKLVERAKGILMKRRGLSEEASFHQMRKASMDRRKSMKEIAEAILLAAELGEN